LSKNKSDKPQREVTRRQLSHWQRESRLQRMILLAGVIIIAVILIVIGTGIYLNNYKPYHTTVIKVGDTKYSMDYYIDMLSLLSGGQPDYVPYMLSYATQQIERDQIFSEEAAKLGITVSDDEIQQFIKDNKLVTSPAQIDLVEFQLLIDKLKNDYFDKQIVPAEQRALLAMFLENQTQVNEIKTRMEKGEKFSDLADQNSLETNSKDKKGDFGWIPRGVLSTLLGDTANTVLDDQVFDKGILPGSLNQITDNIQTKNIGYWLLKVTETDPSTSKIHLLAMLLESQEAADAMIVKLNSGSDFVTEAKTSSQYANASTDGGDLGFIDKTIMGTAVNEVIFPSNPTKTLPLNTLTVVPDNEQMTKGGIWLFEVTEINPSKEITGDSRTIIINQKLDDWATKAMSDNESRIQNLMNSEQESFAIVQAQKRR
jgi:parvulin-like peptidyl-prolyl isomerase